MDAMAVEARHGCKVCGKSFSSGRSLGGHMRSHLSFGEAAAAADELARASASGGRSSSGVVGYGLRENPRKTRRLSDFAAADDDENGGDGDGDGDFEHKACRECGKLFASWSSLSGHMRSHASGGRDRDGDEDVGMEEEFVPEEAEAEVAVAAAAMEAPVLAPPAVTAPRRRRRTMRVAAPPPAPPPPPVLCGFEKEQEDVALCLLMLSRDTALWSSPAKEAPPLGSAKKKKKKKQAGLPRSGDAYNSDDDSALLQHGDAKIKGRRRSSPKQQRGAAAPKRTRYECPGCGKVFSSYQALGGHRASHKRINTSCSAPKLAAAAAAAAPEPSTETYASCSTLSPSASPDSVVSGFARSKAQAVAEAAVEKFGLSHLRLADDGGLYAGGAGQELEQHSAAAAAGFLDLNFPPAPPEEA